MHGTIHGSVSSVLAYIIFKIVGLQFTWPLYVASWLLGMVPDFSGVISYGRRIYHHFILKQDYQDNPYSHRQDIVHKPILYIGIFLTAAILNIWLDFLFWPYFFIALFLIIFHFVMDGIGETEGITWLWPFSKKHFGLLVRADIEPQNWYWWYFHQPYYVVAEILFFLISGLILFNTLGLL